MKCFHVLGNQYYNLPTCYSLSRFCISGRCNN